MDSSTKALRVIGLQAANIKRLQAVALDVSPAGGLVIIGGRNEQGKTSVLDSIWMALGGTRAVPKQPIREGQDKAEIFLTLADEDGKPALLVRRTFTPSGSYLRVETPDGMRPKTPQKLLDELVGRFTFDPPAFTRLSPAEQRDELLAITGLNLEGIDAELAAALETRKDENRELKRLKAAADTALEALPDEQPAMVDADALLAGYHAAEQRVQSINDASRNAQLAARNNSKARQNVADAKEALEAAQETFRYTTKDAAVTVAELDSLGPPPDLEALWAQVANAQKNNELAAQASRVAKMEDDVQAQYKVAGLADQAVAVARTKRDEVLGAADMPTEGLGFSEDGLTLDGLPFEQAADSVKLGVSVAIGMAANPQIRILRIADGSLLDKDHLGWLQAIAEEKDFQIWIERVGSGDPGAIVIEDGMVEAQEKEVKPDEAATPPV